MGQTIAIFMTSKSHYLTIDKHLEKRKVYVFIHLSVSCFRSVPFEARVEQVLGWLDLPAEERPSFIALYFNQPDSAGHAEGPFGDLVCCLTGFFVWLTFR